MSSIRKESLNRRSARAAVTDFVTRACNKLTLSACPPTIENDLRAQLRVFRDLSIVMNWEDLIKKINRALDPPPTLGNPRFVVSRNPSDSDVATTRIED